MTTPTRAAGSRSRGFTLIELLIALAVVAILVRIAFPSYQAYIVRSSRQAAQSELVALANAQERIFLNSNAYTASVTGTYTGQSGGGLGVPTLSGSAPPRRPRKIEGWPVQVLGRRHCNDVHAHRDADRSAGRGGPPALDDLGNRAAKVGHQRQDLVAWKRQRACNRASPFL